MVKSPKTGTHLFVLSGVHKGARVELQASGPLRIGGLPDSDIRLSDLGCLGSAVDIASRGPAVRVERAEGRVKLRSRALKEGSAARLRIGDMLSVGNVELALGRSEEDALRAVGRKRETGLGLRAAGFFAVLAAIWGIGGLSGGFAGTQEPDRPVESRALATPSQFPARSDAVRALARRLSDSGLRGVSVQPLDHASAVRVSGQVLPGQVGAWADAARWFDSEFGGSHVLQSDVEIAGDGIVLPFDVRSIVASPRARVVLGDGSTHFLGDVLPGGWTLTRLAGGSVELMRDGESLRIRF